MSHSTFNTWVITSFNEFVDTSCTIGIVLGTLPQVLVHLRSLAEAFEAKVNLVRPGTCMIETSISADGKPNCNAFHSSDGVKEFWEAKPFPVQVLVG